MAIRLIKITVLRGGMEGADGGLSCLLDTMGPVVY